MSSPWYRLSLSVILTGVLVWFWSGRVDELLYHTVGSTHLYDLGDAQSFENQRTSVPPNSYVSVTGILGNRAATLKGLRAGSLRFGRYQVRHLLGSKVYLEYDESLYHTKFRPFEQITVKGRLVPFGPTGELHKVHEFFKSYYNRPIDKNAMLIVVDEQPRSEIIYPILFLVSVGILILSYFFSLRGFFRRREQDET